MPEAKKQSRTLENPWKKLIQAAEGVFISLAICSCRVGADVS